MRSRLRPAAIVRSTVGRLFERRARRSSKPIGLVLMYHEIAPDQGTADDVLPALGADLFRAQLEHLKRNYEVVPATELLRRAGQRSTGEPLPVAITFDDDFSRHTTVAAPLLSEFGFPATFFLCGNTLTGPDPFWWQDLQVILDREPDAWPKLRLRLAEEWPWAEIDGQVSDFTNTIEAAPPKLRDTIAAKLREIAGDEVLDQGMRSDEVRALAREFDIGFHTRRHYRLETLDGKALDQAMSEGLDELAEVVGQRPATIAYPHAKADLRVADAAQRAGFELGFLVGDVPTTAAQHPLLLARVGGATDSLATFKWVLGQAASRD